MKQHKPLSRKELLKRGKCCHHGCVNCPWKPCKHKCSIREVWEDEEILYICNDCNKIIKTEENTK